MALTAETPHLHSIATPEGVALPFTVATVGDRAGAFLLDFVLIVAACIAVWIVAALATSASLGQLPVMVAILATFVLRNFYFILLEINRGGETLGKRALRLKVIARDGGPLTAEAVVARNLMRELELFLPLGALFGSLAGGRPGAGLFNLLAALWLFAFAAVPFFNRDRLRCGDLAAGTLVVKRPTPVLLPDLASAPTAYRPPTVAAASPFSIHVPTPQPHPDVAAAFVFTREQLDVYGIRELQVLEDLMRRYEGGALATSVLVDVAWRIQRKVGWTEPLADDAAAVRFLEEFYRQQRGRLEQKLLFGQRQERKRDG